ncbi:hypothetical protein EKL30_14895 [Candidimonas sp. SYP-B2681]|uniref:hypothetical protein n=1 Tax=Candidimonas sp. SYP-B2681 TaxID=2497686 RepID=UPI000F87C3F7|nr:hypothetical protein [Candidimonas sp. SYP-B2681]RTZ40978.1 hypothetical protein EKL30_14895 [Candidimonas sp. SYP-B2681]
MSAVEKTRNAILDFMLKAWCREGQALDVNAFYLRNMNHLSRLELDTLEAAADSFVKDGYFEKRQGDYYLTGAGYARLYEG